MIESVVRNIRSADIPVDLNGYLEDVVARLVTAEDSQRTSALIPDQLDMFSEAFAHKIVIRLGDGRRVKFYDATRDHLLVREMNQTEHAAAALNEVRKTQKLRELVADAQRAEPSLGFGDAMKRLGIW
jgi:hypothetical protein